MRKSNINKKQLLINWHLMLVAAVTPSIIIYELTYSVEGAWVFGVLFGVPSVLIVGYFLPYANLDKRREYEIQRLKQNMIGTMDTLRDAMAKLIELEDKYNNG